VLVVILQVHHVFGGGVPVDVADALIGNEERCAGLKGVGRREWVGNVTIVVGDEPLPVGKLSLKERKADGIGGLVRGTDAKAVRGVGPAPVVVDNLGQPCGGSIGIAEPRRNGDQSISGFLIGDMQMLVAEEIEKLVLDKWAGEGTAGDIAV
jgi:hypothetical protein